MKKEYADLDDLDIMDLDVEEDVYTDIDANTDTNIDANTDTNSNINSDTEDTEDTWMESMQEEPYVVLDASIGGKQENSEETIEEYDDIRAVLTENFGEFKNTKWVHYSELNKKLYLHIEDDKIEVCALKKDIQYFGKGWKLVNQDT